MYILGLSAYYHDSAAALIKDGQIVAAAQEERFTRKKHDPAFPAQAIRYCLESQGITLADVEDVIFYDKPLLKFERLLESYLATAPNGFSSFFMAMPVWLKDKLFLKKIMRRELEAIHGSQVGCKILFSDHHRSHAASAFFPSPFNKAAVLCLDGVGEWATTTAWLGDGAKLDALWEIDFPHSLGLLYSAFTYYTGFKVNSGEYKLMGLAPYGQPVYKDLILEKLMDLKEDGTFRLDMKYFDFVAGLKMTSKVFDELFGGPARRAESEITQREMDLARSVQAVTEEIVLRLARTLHRETGADYLCLAGGVALNCVANGRLLREGPFKDIWIQPAAGDAGGAIGAALTAHHQYHDAPRQADDRNDQMRGAYLGPAVEDDASAKYLRQVGAPFTRYADDELPGVVADVLAAENVVGWVQGRMEFGPRALGNRSILGDARSPKMQKVMNLKIKYRESFRPFAPAVLEDDVDQYFEIDRKSPYMLLVAPVRESLRTEPQAGEEDLFGIDKLNVPRSTIPAVTHVDYSARIQTVDGRTNHRLYDLLGKFKVKTGSAVLVNTSFNVRGEPIVQGVEDAYRCFMRTDMDYLVVGNLVLKKSEQPAWREGDAWKKEFTLD